MLSVMYLNFLKLFLQLVLVFVKEWLMIINTVLSFTYSGSSISEKCRFVIRAGKFFFFFLKIILCTAAVYFQMNQFLLAWLECI